MKKPIYKLNINQIIKLIDMFYYTKWCTDFDDCFSDNKHFKIWLKERINLVIIHQKTENKRRGKK